MANAAEEKKAVVKVKFVKAERSGLRVGLARGKKVVLTTASKPSPARRRGALAPRVRVVREIIRDVCGLAPYEKRILDVIKAGTDNAEKKSYKLAKQRLGTHKRALRKRAEMQEYLANYNKARAAK